MEFSESSLSVTPTNLLWVTMTSEPIYLHDIFAKLRDKKVKAAIKRGNKYWQFRPVSENSDYYSH